MTWFETNYRFRWGECDRELVIAMAFKTQWVEEICYVPNNQYWQGKHLASSRRLLVIHRAVILSSGHWDQTVPEKRTGSSVVPFLVTPNLKYGNRVGAYHEINMKLLEAKNASGSIHMTKWLMACLC
ncbi:hypothetical protein FEM48_Zijuj01G0068200 [Ziziphus jujuba var. spinosa]|uniref:Uncharacterized protein n=1 Tax=Ziziphus jujuba var. spinosa TaxID=714518 RepID=A0A978VZR2_ZIZJJ|nr:hypothetical protein FEM48_Zijuj01G0068200 [Ziziphus jujuba var. spinosa]